jgi:hypothetical protein
VRVFCTGRHGLHGHHFFIEEWITCRRHEAKNRKRGEKSESVFDRTSRSTPKAGDEGAGDDPTLLQDNDDEDAQNDGR